MTPRRSSFDRNRSPFLARQKRSTVQVARFKRVEQVERVERHFCVWRFAPPNALRLPSVFHDLFSLSVLERSLRSFRLFFSLFFFFAASRLSRRYVCRRVDRIHETSFHPARRLFIVKAKCCRTAEALSPKERAGRYKGEHFTD